MARRISDRIETAHRLPNNDRTFQFRRLDKTLDIADVRGDPVIDHRRPLAVAMPALIERDASIAFAQHHGNAIPRMRVDTAAVQEKYWRARAAPVEIVKAHRAEDHLLVLRQRDRAGMKISDVECSPKHREFFGTLHFHQKTYSRSRILSTLAMSGSTTIVL